MSAPILPISGVPLPEAIRHVGQARSGNGGFQEVLSTAIQSVQGATQSASTAVESFLAGEGGELHTTILAAQRAQLAFEMFLQARNKVVSAYQEIMRMQM